VTPAAGPFAIACALLATGGAAKAVVPHDTAAALAGIGAPVPSWLVRAGGVAEAAIGLAAIIRGDRTAALLVAASYLAFAVFIAVARARHAPIATCGCFGKTDTPPTLLHLGFDLAASTAAIAVVVQPGVGIGDVLDGQPLSGIPYLMLVATGTYLAFLALSSLPRSLALVTERRAAR
jgi:hypothetical protein